MDACSRDSWLYTIPVSLQCLELIWKKNSKTFKTKIWTISALDLTQNISAKSIYNPDLSKDKCTKSFSSFLPFDICCCVCFVKAQWIKWLTYKLVEVWMWESIHGHPLWKGTQLCKYNDSQTLTQCWESHMESILFIELFY